MYLKLILELTKITISKHQNSKPSLSGSCVKPLWWWSQLHLIFYWSASWVNLKDIYKAVVSLDNEHKIKKWKFHSSHVLKTLSVWQAGIWLQPAHFQIPQSSPVRLGSNCDQVFLVNNKAKKEQKTLSLCFFQCLLVFLPQQLIASCCCCCCCSDLFVWNTERYQSQDFFSLLGMTIFSSTFRSRWRITLSDHFAACDWVFFTSRLRITSC